MHRTISLIKPFAKAMMAFGLELIPKLGPAPTYLGQEALKLGQHLDVPRPTLSFKRWLLKIS
jgi:hypothetical protein